MDRRLRGQILGLVLSDVLIWLVWGTLALFAHGGMSVAGPIVSTGTSLGLFFLLRRKSAAQAHAPVPPPAPVAPAVRRMQLVLGVVVPCFILGMGIYLLVGGWHDRSLTQPIPGGVLTTGQVASVVTYQGKGTTYAAVVEFRTQGGDAERFQGQFGSDKPVVGAPARVSYDPAHPADAHDLTDNPGGWKWPFYTGVFGTGLGLVTVVTTAVALTRRRRQRLGDSTP